MLGFGQTCQCLNHPLLRLHNMLALGSKAFEVDFMNVDNNNIEGLYMVTICIAFLIFVLNIAIINSTPKMVNVSCDD